MRGLKYLAVTVLASALAAGAGKSASVVSDYYTGLALSGYDPVAYFVDSQPFMGRPELELTHRHGVFRFRNEGNRAAFVAYPEIYGPQFAGYDPLALARGIALAGNPLEWLVVDGKLYLFYSASARAAFMANPGVAIAVAAQNWPSVAEKIVP